MKDILNKAVNAMCAGFKKAKQQKQANAANALSAMLRGTKKKKESFLPTTKLRLREAAEIRESKQVQKSVKGIIREGHVCDVVLITEGLGNRRNMNYYGPEAISSAPAIFEGKPCFLDHPSESEERDIPERRVRQKCGYFKNCRVESVNGVSACVGELHFDLSEDGEQAFQKAVTALHYRQEFPILESEYIGLSINADGDVEDRTVQWQGETLQVNYVTAFRDAMSCDIVTSPARGGRFLALVESAAGAKPKHKEVGQMNKVLKKALEAAQTALTEADKETDLEKAKKKTAEAKKLFDAFLKEASKAAESEDENETESESEGEGENEGESEGGDSHTVTTHKVVKKTGKAAVPMAPESEGEADDAGDDKKKDDDDDDAVESKRELISMKAKEAGVELTKGKLDRLARLSLKEAKAEIADLKAMQEAMVKKVIKQIRVPVATLDKVTESDRDGDDNEGASFLESCVR